MSANLPTHPHLCQRKVLFGWRYVMALLERTSFLLLILLDLGPGATWMPTWQAHVGIMRQSGRYQVLQAPSISSEP